MGPHHRLAAAGLSLVLASAGASAGEADVVGARIQPNPDGSFRIEATVRHADTGWDHYANRWEVLGPEGQVLASRFLLHPHVNEQPFSRSLGSVRIPRQWTWVKIRAHDLVHGYGGREVTLTVPGRTKVR